MAAFISLSLCWIWLSVSILRSTASQVDLDQRNITAGQNITLPCQAPNNNIIVIEWSRADVKEEYVLMYRDRHFDSINQHPSFKNRVDLQDKQMKDGDVSLILKNVTVNDTGTYECRVFMKGTNRRKRANLNTDPINKIKLNVVPPGHTGGHTEDGVSRGYFGLLACGLFLLLVLVVALVITRKLAKRNLSEVPEITVSLRS
uniref:programmed cell death 1 ligand 1 n=1 Tax=Maylandia zebra TaxID=106582 RepID=UPI0003298DC6|nr:programmed cell death 1 ligand 1 [Maylandia zebra]